MNKGILWGVGLVAILLVLWYGFSSYLGGMDGDNAGTTWLDGETSFELGDVEYGGGLVTTTLALTNSADEAVTIEDIFSNCGCTSAVINHGPHTIGPFGMPGHDDLATVGTLDWSILPGDEFTAKVTFDPAAHGESSIGESVERKVTIETDKGSGEITFTAHIV